MTEPLVRVTRYEVGPADMPLDSQNRYHFLLYVEDRGNDRWCVKDLSWCYDADGNTEYESSPTNRTDEFKDRFRFPLEEALALAKRLQPQMRLGKGPNNPGQTSAQVWAWEQSR